VRRALVVVIAAVIVGAGWKWYETPDAAEVRRDLPIYPGAEFVQQTDDVLYYRLLRPANREAVQAFYKRRLEGWKAAGDCPDIGFERERTLLLVGPDGINPRRLNVLVKPGGAGDCEEWAWFIYS
jgi:hypothetical protein